MITLVCCLLGRAFMILFLSGILNCCLTEKINYRYQTVMWIAGLRGPVAFALALIAPLMSTLIVVFLTTVVLGGLTGVILGEFAHLGMMDEQLNAKTPLTHGQSKSKVSKNEQQDSCFLSFDANYMQ